MAKSIHQRYTDNILIGATVSSTPAPMATYDDDTLLTMRPGDRVRWSAGTVTITFTLSSSQRADLLVIPIWNVDAGSSVATLTNGAGLNVPITVPTMMPSGIPRTTAIDISLLQTNPTTRTSGTFVITVTGNTANLIMGGAVLLYGPKRPFVNRDWHFGMGRSQRGYAIAHENEYGTDLVSSLRTRTRSYEATTICTEAEALDLELWADANFGHGRPGLLWPIPDTYEAYFGRLEDVQTQRVRVRSTRYVEVSLTFTEISKGKPVV